MSSFSRKTNLDPLVALQAVPGVDSAAAANARDIIGNKSDTANATIGTTSSLMRYVKGLFDALSVLALRQKTEVTCFDATTLQTEHTLTNDASVHTWGAYEEIIAVTAEEYIVDCIMLKNRTVTPIAGTRVMTELAIGAIASEVCIMKIPWMITGENEQQAAHYYYPQARIVIPSGSRLSMRVMDSLGSVVTYATLITVAK